MAMIEPGPAGNAVNESGWLCVANDVCPGNWKPGDSPDAGAATACENSASIMWLRLSTLVKRCVTRATWPPGSNRVVCCTCRPESWKEGQVVVVGGNVAGGLQIVGTSVSLIKTL